MFPKYFLYMISSKQDLIKDYVLCLVVVFLVAFNLIEPLPPPIFSQYIDLLKSKGS